MGLVNKTQYEYYNDSSSFGNYQFISIEDIINNFMVAYVGEDKIISKIKRNDVAFHAQRALQELSFDTFKATKALEIEVPATLSMVLPQDYVNYTNIAWVDNAGIQHTIYPALKTANPKAITQDANNDYVYGTGNLLENGDFTINSGFTMTSGTVTYDSANKHVDFTAAPKWHKLNWYNIQTTIGESYTLTYTISNYSGTGSVQPRLYSSDGHYVTFATRSANGTYTETVVLTDDYFQAGYENRFWISSIGDTAFTGSIDDVTLTASSLSYQSESNSWTNYKNTTPNENINQDYNTDHDDYDLNLGQRYGLDPRFAQTNGSFYIDEENGKIHFSSNISGKTIILKYISDSLATDEEMRVHKFAEEAMYKCILCNVVMARRDVSPSMKMMYKKEKFTATRTAKLRLSNIKIEELAQLLRGRSKIIKH